MDFIGIFLAVSDPLKPNFITEVFLPEIFFNLLSNWKFFAFLFILFIFVLIFRVWENKMQFLSYLRQKDKEKKWKVEFEEKKRQKDLKKLIKDIVPHWTPEVIQSLDSKAFIKLVAEYFETKGFLTKFPTSTDKNTVDVFFLHQPEHNMPFAIVKCRAIGRDLVSLETVKLLSDLSKQYGLINLAVATTGYFENDPTGLIKNKKGFNLIGAPQLISMLTALPIEEQTYLFANMMLNKN
jgi:hypothetical protein